MSGVINVISRPMGESDVAFGANSFVYVDINGVARRVQQVNANSVPWLSIPAVKMEALVDGSKNLPLGASSFGVVNTSTFSGPMFGSGTTSGIIRNNASGMFLFGQTIAVGDLPTGIPAVDIASGIVNDATFGYLYGATSNIQSQINALASGAAGAGRLQYFQPAQVPDIAWVSASTIQVLANASTPAQIIMNGFPDVVNPGQFVTAGLTNSQYYFESTNTQCVFPSNLYGTVEAASQWYAIYAVAGATGYALYGMPWLRVKSQASQVISFGTNVTPATGIGYGFTSNQFAAGQLYVVSGASAGLLRTITANNNDNTTGGTVTYSGAALSLAQGDWFIILPPAVNFRWIGDVWNNGSSNIERFTKVGTEFRLASGTKIEAVDVNSYEQVPYIPPLAYKIGVTGPAASALGLIQIGYPNFGQNIIIFINNTPIFAEVPIKLCSYAGYTGAGDAGAIIPLIYVKYPSGMF